MNTVFLGAQTFVVTGSRTHEIKLSNAIASALVCLQRKQFAAVQTEKR